MPQSNGNLSGLEVAAYLHAAGFGAGNGVLQTAVAVARAESSWNPRAKGGPNGNGSYDYGLMQINDIHKPTAAEKTEPLANARRAFAIYKAAGNSFRPWSAYNSGAHKAHMEVARQSVVALQNRPSFEKELLTGKNPGSDGNPISGGKEGDNGWMPDGVGSLDPMAGIAAAIGKAIGGVNAQASKAMGQGIAVVIAVALLVLGVVILLRQGATNALGGVVKGALK